MLMTPPALRGHLPIAVSAMGRKTVSTCTNGALAFDHVCTDPGTSPRRPDQAQRHLDPLCQPPPYLAADERPGEPHRRRAIRAGRATRRPRGHPGAEQRPLLRAD